MDKGAYSGEADNAAIMLIRKLRERNVSAEEFIKQPEIEQYYNALLVSSKGWHDNTNDYFPFMQNFTLYLNKC